MSILRASVSTEGAAIAASDGEQLIVIMMPIDDFEKLLANWGRLAQTARAAAAPPEGRAN